MIALNETIEAAAEVPFYLPTIVDPTVGLTGYTFTDDGSGGAVEVQIKPVGGSWGNATLLKVSEKGFGRYVVRLTAAQCVTAGVVYVKAVVSGSSQPYFGSETIGVLGGDIPVGQAGYFPFYMPNVSDPIFGSPITGYTFSTGEVMVCLPDGTYGDADVSDIVEIGFGSYALLLDTTDTANRGKVFLYATATGAQRFEGYQMILGVGVSPAPAPPPTPPIVVPTGVAALIGLSHVQAAIDRLCEYAKDADS